MMIVVGRWSLFRGGRLFKFGCSWCESKFQLCFKKKDLCINARVQKMILLATFSIIHVKLNMIILIDSSAFFVAQN